MSVVIGLLNMYMKHAVYSCIESDLVSCRIFKYYQDIITVLQCMSIGNSFHHPSPSVC